MAIMQLNQYYTFDVYGENFIANVEKGLITSIIDGRVANLLGYDVAAMHSQVFPHLPENSPEKFLDQPYYLIEFGDGQRAVYGESWIKRSTITSTSHRKVIVTFPSVTVEEQLIIPAMLDSYGLRYTIETQEVPND